MSKHYDHGELKDDKPRGKITYAYNNFNAGVAVDFETYNDYVPSWQFSRDTGNFQFVSGSDNTSMSRLVYDTFNN